jgi:hypothetical protein
MTANGHGFDGQRFVQARAAMSREVTDGLVVLGPTADRPTHITGSAVLGWAYFERPTMFDAVVAQLVEAHGADPTVVHRDLAQVVAVLVRDGALESVVSE